MINHMIEECRYVTESCLRKGPLLLAKLARLSNREVIEPPNLMNQTGRRRRKTLVPIAFFEGTVRADLHR